MFAMTYFTDWLAASVQQMDRTITSKKRLFFVLGKINKEHERD